MTLSEFRAEVWEISGEDTNLSSAAGILRVDRWINRAYKRILFWRFPDGTQVRFPCLDGLLYFKTVVLTGTIVSAGTQDVTLDDTFGAGLDQYNGWIIEVEGVRMQIMDYDTSRLATVHDAWSTAPTAGAACTLYKNFVRLCESGAVGADENVVLSPVTQVMEIKKITNIKRFWDLVPMERTDTGALRQLTLSYPRQYMRIGNDIVFDYPALEEEYYRMEYVRMPPDLSVDSDVPEIPSYFDEAIILDAVRSVLVWQQDNDEAYARKKDLQDFMLTVKQQGEMGYERENGQATVIL
jgi:hypothetical protein